MKTLIASSRSPLARLVRSLFKGNCGHPLIKRNHERFKGFDQDLPLADYEFTVLDTELTGMRPGRDEIVSIGAVKIRGLSILPGESFHSLVHPQMEMPKFTTLIHHITPERAKKAPPLEEVLPAFLEYLGDSLIVGHYVGLDVSFLNVACKKTFGGALVTPCLDTMRLAMSFQEELWGNFYERYDSNVSYNLARLAEKYELPLFEQHDALADALQAAYLFLFLSRKMRGGGIRTLRDLYLAGKKRVLNY